MAMQKFILDLRWTPQGLANLPSGHFHDIRKEAVLWALQNGVKVIPPILERLSPTPVGPIWIVEGEEGDVVNVVTRFNLFGNVTAQYFYYIEDDQSYDIIAKLVEEPTPP